MMKNFLAVSRRTTIISIFSKIFPGRQYIISVSFMPLATLARMRQMMQLHYQKEYELKGIDARLDEKQWSLN